MPIYFYEKSRTGMGILMLSPISVPIYNRDATLFERKDKSVKLESLLYTTVFINSLFIKFLILI